MKRDVDKRKKQTCWNVSDRVFVLLFLPANEKIVGETLSDICINDGTYSLGRWRMIFQSKVLDECVEMEGMCTTTIEK